MEQLLDFFLGIGGLAFGAFVLVFTVSYLTLWLEVRKFEELT